MFMKILAASAFTIALATSAMAQSNSAAGADGSGGSGESVTVDPSTPASPSTIDPGSTNSTTTTPGDMNSNADKNCPTNPQGAQTDANGNATAPTVNDNNCGK
ncbi:hypothetical protein NKI51_16890 [Mesorhizobium australicum]|jgi:hypothetical protein|uniref:Uncharacterized protein n=1 Tax=Mesorhizobium australicum TaxID=536018 RepID=A0ACC6SWV0_9HYPH|nr:MULTISPECIES: hypothetical protein [unclassified Mesorhizobium]ESY86293.1 hypothetical protein X739_13915 [Mesorhizobium sp. LNHC220B00]ESY97004.1 hypothetical protein X741_00125 [Mesorhizobium sp. LNHC229A00]ESZ01836.1 hypothetical protein X738_03390 [Mesorhizobium sp. LNHC209A00]